jgi:hypothetical protein
MEIQRRPVFAPLARDHRFRIVTADSARAQKSVTFGRNRRSRCSGTVGHVHPEIAVTILRKPRSRSPGIIGHVGPEYAVTSKTAKNITMRVIPTAILYVARRLRIWMMRRQGRRGTGYRQFSDQFLYETLGLIRLLPGRASMPNAKV